MNSLKSYLLDNKLLFIFATVLLAATFILYLLNIPYGDLVFIGFACIALIMRVASRTLFILAVIFLAGVLLTLVAIGGQNRLSLSMASYSFILLMAGVLAVVAEQWFEIKALTK